MRIFYDLHIQLSHMPYPLTFNGIAYHSNLLYLFLSCLYSQGLFGFNFYFHNFESIFYFVQLC